MQIVNIAPDEFENSWISDVRIQDGLADVETPTKFVVDLRHTGHSPRHDVQVGLWVEKRRSGGPRPSRSTPATETREVRLLDLSCFSSYQPESERPLFVPGAGGPSRPDKLSARRRAVPGCAGGGGPAGWCSSINTATKRKSPSQNPPGGNAAPAQAAGACYLARRGCSGQLIKVRHLSYESLTEESLADARGRRHRRRAPDSKQRRSRSFATICSRAANC